MSRKLRDGLAKHVDDMTRRIGPGIEADLRKQAKIAARLRRGEPAIGWKAMFETEQTLREAWTKRAIEAEAELAALKALPPAPTPAEG